MSTSAFLLFTWFAVAKDLINNLRDWGCGVDRNTVLRKVFFRLVQSPHEFPLRRLSATPLRVRALVKSPIQCIEVDLKNKDGVEEIYKLSEVS